MSNDVALSASIRQNLQSLQSTNNLLNDTTNRLATGREVNSVFDDPINFVASQNLNDQANDLSRLLDGIGQNIRSIEQAVNGTNAIEGLLDQAQAITNSAREAISDGGSQATVTGNTDISDLENLVDENGVESTTRLDFTLTDPSDPDTPIIDAGSTNTTLQNIAQIDFAADFAPGPISADDLVNAINDINDQLRAENEITDDVIQARLDENGQLDIRALNGGDLQLNLFSDASTAADQENDAENLNLAQTLGLSGQTSLVNDGTLTGGFTQQNDVTITALGSPTLQSVQLFADEDGFGVGGDGRIAQASDSLNDLFTDDTVTTGANGNQLFANTGGGQATDAGDLVQISVNGNTSQTVDIDVGAGATIQDFVDDINNDSALGSQIQASFDSTTGQINLRALSEDVQTIDISLNDAGTGADGFESNLGFGVDSTQTATASGTTGAIDTQSIALSSAAGELLDLENQFNDVRTQIDQLVSDAGFRGTNLLNGDVLETVFNADRTSSIETEGAIFTASGLGLNTADFTSASNIDSFDSNVRTATLEVRNFGARLTNDLNVIQTRETFTNSTISTLQAASDDLTLADQEEESARLLALQTRQSLGITSLSLANQSQQGILRLF